MFCHAITGFQERLGEIRDFKGIRGAFMRIPEVFCSKVTDKTLIYYNLNQLSHLHACTVHLTSYSSSKHWPNTQQQQIYAFFTVDD
jgi:hypothetical protein